MRVFFDQPAQQHYLNEISRKSDLSHTSVKKHLQALKEEELIEKHVEEKGSREYPRYVAEQETEDYKFYKKLDLLDRLRTTGLLDYLEDNLFPDCIVLFGSAARGEDIETSDVDLFVQAKDKKLDIEEFEDKLNRKLELHLKEELADLPQELKNNLANGIVLQGFLEVFS